MFIEFGRLGCKHIIYLGEVMFMHAHMTFWLKHKAAGKISDHLKRDLGGNCESYLKLYCFALGAADFNRG